MIDREKVVCAIENCIGQPKCKDCPWEDCEVEHEVVNHVPYGLLRDAIALLREQEAMRWISVKDRLPEQHDTIFAKLKGTDKWRDGLFEKQSDDVRVVIEYPDGYRRVHHSYLVDGVWACETLPPEGRKVLYWCENPELPKEEG